MESIIIIIMLHMPSNKTILRIFFFLDLDCLKYISVCLLKRQSSRLIKKANSETLYYIRRRKRTRSLGESQFTQDRVFPFPKWVRCHLNKLQIQGNQHRNSLGWSFQSGQTAFSASPLWRKELSAWEQFCWVPWLSCITFQALRLLAQPSPLYWFSLAHVAVEKWCQEALTPVSNKLQMVPPQPQSLSWCLLLGTTVIVINGRVIGWAKMQVFQGDLQSSIL